MNVTFLGTGAAMPVPDRAQTGLLFESDGRTLLVDCGAGVLHRLSGTDAGYEGVSTVLLTHHHLDHVADLLPLLKARWLAGEEHLEIVGPTGTKALLDGLLSVHEYMDGRCDLAIREIGDGTTATIAGFEIEAKETRHSLSCLAYRFGVDDASEPAFAYSGDSEAFAGLTRFLSAAPIVAHDCSFPDDVDVSNHPTPSVLGEEFADSGVDRLYLTHLYPHTDGRHEEMRRSIARSFDGEVRFARDGLQVTLE